MDKIARICQEIERHRQAIRVLNEHTAPEQASKTCAIFQYSDTILSELLSFLDTLSEEPDKSLEKAARRYAIPTYMKDVDENFLDEYPYDPVAEKAFIAGAEWQKAKMLKEAVEGTIVDAGFDDHTALVSIPDKRYDEGDKICIIIVKED